MPQLLLLPLVLQGVFIFLDEFLFHRKRGLGTWEVWGHPLDTLTVGFVFSIAAFTEYNSTNEMIFLGASIFSSLFVTKDEFIHAKFCPPMEHWLHAILFLLHPISFLAAWALWREALLIEALQLQTLLILGFMLYQITYWGHLWKQ